ncbi:MAG: hypothetical protein HY551_07680 [Elusimicrobia bacterium]|nr:hypothetical protein [Elusimicrobiota bacterium]
MVFRRPVAIAVMLVVSALSLPFPAHAAYRFMGTDLYGTDRVGAADLESKFGDPIRLYFKKRTQPSGKAAEKEAEALKRRIEVAIRKAWGFEWVRLTWMEYFKQGDNNVHVTIDVLEPRDAKTRMPFRQAPRKSYPDPSRLLETWSRYLETGWALVRRGEISSDRADCPAFHCVWGDQNQELRELQDHLIRMVPSNRQALERILAEDKTPSRRANAAYALAYIGDGNELSRRLQGALLDPDIEVRAAAMQIYSDIAIHHPDVYLPVEHLGAALHYPTVEDRSKALAVMLALADRKEHRRYMLLHAASPLLRLLRSGQPATRDMAYAVLGVLSKQDFPRDRFEAWDEWVQKERARLRSDEPAP